MNKKTIRIAGWALGLSMAVAGIGVAVGASRRSTIETKATTFDWELVTSAPTDWSGTYLIASDKSGTVKVMNATSLNSGAFSALSGTQTVTEGGLLSGIDDSYAITIIPSKAGTANKYTVQAGSNYIGKNANNNGVDSVATSGTYTANYDNTISFNPSTKVVTIAGNGGRTLTWYSNNSNFKYYSSTNNCTRLFRKIDNTPSVTLSANSSSGLKGDNDDTLSITVENVNATGCIVSYKDNGAEEGTSAPGVASVTPTKNGSNYSLLVNYLSVGTSVATITVTDGNNNYPVSLSITVAAKPKSIVASAKAGTPWVDGKLEVKSGGNGSSGYKEVAITALDTDDATYTGALTWESSDEGVVGVTSTGRIYGVAAGEATVTVSATALPSIKDTITVKVMDDYRNGVKPDGVTFNDDLTANSGDTLDIDGIFKTRVATTYFGSTDTIADEELLFSYNDNDYAGAVNAEYFTYLCDKSTEVGQAEEQVVYVYSSLNPSWKSSFTISVTKTNVALTGLSMSNVIDNAKNLARNTTFQIELAFSPENATDKRVTYSIDAENSDLGHSVSVSSTGLVSAGSTLGKKARVVVTSIADDTKKDYVDVTVVRETQTMTTVKPTSINKITSDQNLSNGNYLIVCDSQNVAFDGSRNNSSNKIDAGQNNVPVTISESAITSDSAASYFTITAVTGGYTIKSASGFYIGRLSSSNGMDVSDETAYVNTISFSNGKAVIQGKNGENGTFYLRYNATSGSTNERFRYYASDKQTDVYLYKISGGEESVTISDSMYNAVVTAESNIACDPAGVSSVISWSAVKTAINGLSNPNKENLTYGVAKDASSGGNEVEEFLAKYDYIVGKYDMEDFLSRKNKSVYSYSPAFGTAIWNSESSDSALPLTLTLFGAASLAAGGLFITRKRRKEE